MNDDLSIILKSEVVLLPFPHQVGELCLAARQFSEQYRVQTRIEVRGHVMAQDNLYCLLDEWTQVGAIDRELELIALGELDEDEETMTWLRLAGPGQVRLSAQEP